MIFSLVLGIAPQLAWNSTWIIDPPSSSSASKYVKVNCSNQDDCEIKIHELIPVIEEGDIVASLQFQGSLIKDFEVNLTSYLIYDDVIFRLV